jgi:hypothetical protein
MLDIHRALHNESVLRSLTGLRIKQFVELHRKFAIELSNRRIDTSAERQRAPGGGRRHTLENSEGMLFFILLYLKVYPTMELAGFLFGVAKSQTCTWVKAFRFVLEAVPGKTHDLPRRKISTAEEFIELFPNVRKLVVDGTERPGSRPKDSGQQRRHYSGKKKRHTFKNTQVADPKWKKVPVLTPTTHGSVHDKKDLDSNDILNP